MINPVCKTVDFCCYAVHIYTMKTIERRREKLKNAVLFFVKNDSTVGLTKLMKLLFYLDFRLFRECGESLTGQIYEAWQFGPVPADVWRELHDKGDCQLGLSSVIKVTPVKSDPRDEATGIKLSVLPKAKFSDRLFTGRELRELRNISEMFKGVPAKTVVKAAHQKSDPWDVTLKQYGEKSVIDYELALSGLGDEETSYIHEVRDDAALLESLLG